MAATMSRMKSTSRPPVMPPNRASARNTPRSFGTKVSVCSLIEVAACTRPMTRPMTSAGTSAGSTASDSTQSAWRALS
jgi:hypothetical protein